MFFDNYIPKEEAVFTNYEDAAEVARCLLKNNYCVMLSREEDLWILNYIWSPHADRNDMIFADRGSYECDEMNWIRCHPEINFGEEEE